ncbi:MAG: outer membrane protein assembly factor BamE [Cellvibrionaceae bacterium]|nr:outer membrane protein assembly factor BamE [Cellvibrionaceae bacterium]
MYLFFRIISVLIITFTAAACSFVRFPGAYKVVIQQGNFIEEEMVEQLETGMNREQVNYIMGTPMVADTFNADRWDYFFNVKRGGKLLTNYHFKVYFEEGRLARWEGDYRKKNQTMDSTTGGTDPKLVEPVDTVATLPTETENIPAPVDVDVDVDADIDVEAEDTIEQINEDVDERVEEEIDEAQADSA